MYPLNDDEFKYISQKVYEYSRIHLSEKKKALMVSRLSKRIRNLKLSSFAEYIDYIENDATGKEFVMMIDSLSTNFSHFFREFHHFEFLSNTFLKKYHNKDLNIWSAASSTGQEIYSILMTIKEYEADKNTRIKIKLFASDISREVLKTASKGVYQTNDVSKIDKTLLQKYFLKGKSSQEGYYKMKKKLIAHISFFRLNLNDKTYSLPQMDIIFLRNAIIYFDMKTKIELVDRLYHYIKPGGYLILGHSESLSGISDKFKLLGNTIYERKD